MQIQESKIKVSIIICTYNRSKLLKETLQSVQNQDFQSDQYEIIVVDNNSTDDTKDVVAEMAKASPVSTGYVFEYMQGLSNARNAGINNSEGEIIVFTDDDVEAERSWLRELFAAFETPGVAAAGGPIRPIWPFEKPEWITENWQGYFTVSEFPEAREAGEFRNPNYPWGANMAFRRSILKKTDLFSPALGRIGACLLSNEELRLFRAIEEMGHRIVLAPDAVIHHKIPPERVRKLWLYHRTYWQGRSEAILDRQSGNYVYSRLRAFSSGMLWRKLLSDKTDFEKECLDRITTGYLYQLLQTDENVHADFNRLRALETFLGGLAKTAVNNIRGTKDHLSEKQGQLAERNGQLGKAHERLKECDAKIEELLAMAAQKNEQLARDREKLLVLEEKVKGHEEELRRRDERITDMLNSMSWKITSPLRTVYGILLRQKR